MAFRKLADLAEIPRGKTRFFRVAGGPVILANVGGEVYALSGICPHKKNPLEGATLIDHLLDCPWHHFQYDVRTGENHFPRNVYPDNLSYLKRQLRPLRRYPVELRGAEIWVDVDNTIEEEQT